MIKHCYHCFRRIDTEKLTKQGNRVFHKNCLVLFQYKDDPTWLSLKRSAAILNYLLECDPRKIVQGKKRIDAIAKALEGVDWPQ